VRHGIEDRCPGVLRLHPAQDGGLARVRLPGGMLGRRQLRALAAAAALGSDIVELTARAGVQIRGVSDRSAADVERILRAGGLIPSVTHDRVRNVLASPLGGRHADALMETDAVVAALDGLLCADPRLAALPGRFLFEVDDASGIGRTTDPSHTAPDVTLLAIGSRASARARLRLVLGGFQTDLVRSEAAAPGLAIAAAGAFLARREELASDAWHLADLPDGPAHVAACLGGTIRRLETQPPGRRPSGVGVTRQADGRHAVCGLARLGRLDSAQLDGLAEVSTSPGGIRVSPWRTITVVDVPAGDAAATAAALAEIGLEVGPGSPWVGLSACAGRGACASARIDVRSLAARRAASGRAAGETEHWSGCERRCGEPGGAQITVAPRGAEIAVRIGGVERLLGTPAEVAAALAAEGG
jgi:precorrin-3B synthase